MPTLVHNDDQRSWRHTSSEQHIAHTTAEETDQHKLKEEAFVDLPKLPKLSNVLRSKHLEPWMKNLSSE